MADLNFRLLSFRSVLVKALKNMIYCAKYRVSASDAVLGTMFRKC